MAQSGKSPEALVRRHPVLEALRDGRRDLNHLWVEQAKDNRDVRQIVDEARSRHVPVTTIAKPELDRLAQQYRADAKHQGVLLETGPYVYSEPEAMLELARKRDEYPLLLILDLLHGPQNIGTLLRTAEVVGAHGVIVQDRRAPEITPAVVQYSVGASEHLLIAKVTNLVQTITYLQEQDVWIAGMDMDDTAEALNQVDLNRSLGIVVGHEGEGLRRLVRDRCDFLATTDARPG
ncbi:MAG: RNA methyltransferase [Chloroflexota bacterium]